MPAAELPACIRRHHRHQPNGGLVEAVRLNLVGMSTPGSAAAVRLRRPRVSARFRAMRRWVCFSDLHLTAASQSVAMEVLERVHAEAAARDAGVLFLGDFWHHRGKLPVEPLNAAVEAFVAWRRPTIMLTGNHDQVSIGGQVHALNALSAAAKPGLVKVVAEPTLLLGALWLPYRRRQEELSRERVQSL